MADEISQATQASGIPNAENQSGFGDNKKLIIVLICMIVVVVIVLIFGFVKMKMLKNNNAEIPVSPNFENNAAGDSSKNSGSSSTELIYLDDNRTNAPAAGTNTNSDEDLSVPADISLRRQTAQEDETVPSNPDEDLSPPADIP